MQTTPILEKRRRQIHFLPYSFYYNNYFIHNKGEYIHLNNIMYGHIIQKHICALSFLLQSKHNVMMQHILLHSAY
jgi:hypothetical protein